MHTMMATSSTMIRSALELVLLNFCTLCFNLRAERGSVRVRLVVDQNSTAV